VLLTVFTMILETMQTAFERNAVSKVAYGIAYLVLLFLAVGSFRSATSYAGEAIEDMIQFMLAMVPLLLTLLAGTGSVATVAVLHPLIVFMIHTVGTVIHLFVFPLLFFSAVLHLVSSISDRYSVTQLANLLRNVGAGVMGVMFTVFLGVLSLQGLTSAAVDGVAVRTAKFVAGNFIPVVGKMFSDATDTVLTASMLVKNAVGLVGVIILLFLCAFPAIKILTLALIYNVAGAVLQPLGNSPVVTCLQTIGKTLVFVFAALAVVGLMFFLAVTIILTAGNAALLIR
jgi:stage III sporulation protein AE